LKIAYDIENKSHLFRKKGLNYKLVCRR